MHIHQDHELLVDLVTVMDMIKLRLERLLRRSFKSAADEMTPPPEEGDKSAIVKFAKSLAPTSSRENYDRMRQNYTSSQNIELKEFPSWYSIKKMNNQPSIEPINLCPEDVEDDDNANYDFDAIGLDVNVNNTTYSYNDDDDTLKPKVTAKSFVGKSDVKMKDALEEIKQSKGHQKVEDVMVAKISGAYNDYIQLMYNKLKVNNIKLDDRQIIIDSYDGAEHKKTTKGKIGIISFNSQMLSQFSIDKASPASSTNILTWQQVVGEEKFSTLLPALKKIYQSKAEIRADEESRKKYVMYELHDRKMLYLLTQHSLFNRKYKPFLLCSCGRGEGVRNRNHKCKILTDIEQQQWCNRSKRRWDLKRPVRNKYGRKEHMNWVDKHNNGISHFGFSPNIFPRSSISDSMSFTLEAQ